MLYSVLNNSHYWIYRRYINYFMACSTLRSSASYSTTFSSSFSSQLCIPQNGRYWQTVLFQEEDPLGVGTHIGGCNGDRVLVRCRNSFRISYPAEDRRKAWAYDPGVGTASSHRLLRHSDPGLTQWPLQPVLGQTAALYTLTGHRNPYRCSGFIWNSCNLGNLTVNFVTTVRLHLTSTCLQNTWPAVLNSTMTQVCLHSFSYSDLNFALIWITLRVILLMTISRHVTRNINSGVISVKLHVVTPFYDEGRNTWRWRIDEVMARYGLSRHWRRIRTCTFLSQ